MMKTDPHDRADLTCRGTTYLVSDARDRPLTADEQASLARHIQGCPRCQVASRQFADLFAQLEALFGRERPAAPPHEPDD